MTNNGSQITIVLLDDHTLMRAGLKALLSMNPNFQIVGEAADGIEGVRVIAREKPDVVLVDLRIPRLHGLEVMRQIKEVCDADVIVVSMHEDIGMVRQSIRHGASGYVVKHAAPEELMDAIRTVIAGGQYLCKSLRAAVLRDLAKNESGAGAQLSNREQIVFQLAAEGKGAKEIADILFVSRRTVESHRGNIMRKLHLKNQTDLVLAAVREGILTP